MALFREVRCFAYDVVAPRIDGGNPFAVVAYGDTVAYRHGVGGADAFEAEIALYAAFHHLSVIGADDVAAAGISYYGAVHVKESGCVGGRG